MAAPTSGSQAAKQNGTAQSGGRKRHVKSQAGVTRYGKPIGSEIGGPRDANHAAIQQDQGARKNYGDLISGDQAKQRQALDGMSTDDLNKLADISFSFKSSDPKVVALRIAARNAQARRGIHVKVGQTQTNPTGGKAAPSVNYNNRGNAKALSNLGPASQKLVELANAAKQHTASTGSFPIPDVAHLRKAIQAIGRAKPEHRPIIARHIIARAGALKATHLVSDHIKHYARGSRQPGTVGMSRAEAGAIELAGRWKHGYIPLDAEAMASKMKGRTGGKKWWGDGTRGGVSGNLKPHGSPKSGSPQRHGGPVKNPHKLNAAQKEQGRTEANARRTTIGQPPRPAPKGDSTKLTKVVKSEVPKTAPRGAKVTNPPNAAFSRQTMIKRAKENGLSQADAEKWADNPNRPMLLGNKPVGPSRTPKPGDKQDTTGKSKLTFQAIDPVTRKPVGDKPAKTTPKQMELLKAGAAHPDGEVHVKNQLQGESLAKQGLTKKVGPKIYITDKGRAHAGGGGGTKPTPSTSDKAKTDPNVLAKNYVQMHGSDGARTKIAQLEGKAKPTARDRAMIAALKSAAAGGGPGKA